MIDINEIDADQNVEIICDPAVNNTLKELLRKESIVTVRLVDIPELGNTIKMVFSYGGEIELHYSAGVKVNGVLATDNTDLYNKLKSIFAV